MKMKKGAESIFQEIKNKIGQEGMEKVLRATFTDENDNI
jgi:predicted Co/Zn/Cd cation transporter (cation efflux family)